MRRAIPAILLLLSLTAVKTSAQEKPPTPAEQFAALKAEYNTSTSAPRVLTDEERRQFVGQVYRHHSAVAVKLVALAEKYPGDPVALAALQQAVSQVNTMWPVELVGDDPARGRAFELLLRDHVRSDQLSPLCERISYGFAREYETFLRAVLERNPHRGVQALACLSLARYLNNRLQRVDLCREQPAQATEFAELFGKAYLAGLLRRDRGKAFGEVKAAFTRAAEKYGDVKLPEGEGVGARARAELALVRGLSIGKEAPEIEAEDQDGQRFKLSDYRGKVVLLDFWSFV